MSIHADILTSAPVRSLCESFMAEYSPRAVFRRIRPQVPEMVSALGACAGFSAQLAVWRELVLPIQRNPGDFLVYVTTKTGELFFMGEAVNLFLVVALPDRLSFFSLAAAAVSRASERPDVLELCGHAAGTFGKPEFGRPRLPAGVTLTESPLAALKRNWPKVETILAGCGAAEWPALLGAATQNMIKANGSALAPRDALKIALEAAVPMSRVNPVTVARSLIPPPPAQWSMRALRPDGQKEILAEVRAVMPVVPAGMVAPALADPTIAFLNLAGEDCAAIFAEDNAEIGAGFGKVIRADSAPIPPCDILFLYCKFDESGRVLGQEAKLRDLIGASRACIAVVASDVPAKVMTLKGWLDKGSNPPVNLVVILNRNGKAFVSFFSALFEYMRSGMSMPMAWVTLAPQAPPPSPGASQRQPPRDDVPGTICLMEAGQVTFAKGQQ